MKHQTEITPGTDLSANEQKLTETGANDTNNTTCPDCSKTFKNPRGLRIHKMRIHEGRTWSNARTTIATKRTRRARKQALLTVDHNPSQQVHDRMNVPHFCPHCGGELLAVILAMNIKGGGK